MTSTSFIDIDNLISPPTNHINDEKDPQDNVLNDTTTKLNDPMPGDTLSPPSIEEPLSDDPPKQRNDKAILCVNNKLFLDPNQ